MKKTFIEMKLFQVKPDKLEQFEAKIEEMTANQFKCEGCISLKSAVIMPELYWKTCRMNFR